MCVFSVFFFQAEDGIRDLVRSRGLGDVYKRQVRTLVERFGPPKRPLEVLSFCEEESSRFASTNFWGSRAITGVIGPDETETVVGFDGIPIGEALRAAGLEPALSLIHICRCRRAI